MRAILLLLPLVFAFLQNGYDLFQKALVKERAEGKLEEAIQIYEQIIREFSTDRALVAKAQDAKSRVIVIHSIETGEEREVQPHLNDVRNLNWAPDGQSFFVRATDAKGQRGIYRVSIPDGDTMLIRASEPENSVQWLVVPTDGNTIYFTEHRKGRRAVIASLDLETGVEKDLVSGPWFGDFGVSPDGQYVVFHTANSKITNQSLKWIPATGGETHELAAIATPTPSWSGFGFTLDSRFVIFATRDNQVDQLWKIAVDGGSPQKLDLTAENIRAMRIHPDGRRIAFTAGQAKSEVWVMENFLRR